MHDPRMFSAACERNREPILEVLREALPERGLVLEIASGTGMHGAWFAPRLGPAIVWQPTDASPEALASIEAWRASVSAPNLLPPRQLDVTEASWPVDEADAIFSANMIHISPWACTEGLFAGAERVLDGGAPLVLYGPFLRDDVATAPSNVAFDESLRARNPAWGIRALAAVSDVAGQRGFALEGVVDMPANNVIVTFRRQ
ncbi:MAG: DUF938 domain-containing protein [Sandaracinaceae bacterium]